MEDKIEPIVEVEKEVVLSEEEQAVKNDAELVVRLQSKNTELTPEEAEMLHLLIVTEQIRKSLEKQLESNSKDPMVIAGLKDGLVEAKLELEEVRKVFEIAKVREDKISKIV